MFAFVIKPVVEKILVGLTMTALATAIVVNTTAAVEIKNTRKSRKSKAVEAEAVA